MHSTVTANKKKFGPPRLNVVREFVNQSTNIRMLGTGSTVAVEAYPDRSAGRTESSKHGVRSFVLKTTWSKTLSKDCGMILTGPSALNSWAIMPWAGAPGYDEMHLRC